jgi:hypothetical protein
MIGPQKDEQDVERKIQLYNIYRDYVKHEDNLINNRMTWLLSIHGFLYATYGLTLQKKFEISQKIVESTSHVSAFVWDAPGMSGAMEGYGFDYVSFQIDVFLIGIGLVGIFISRIALESIEAAGRATQTLRTNANIAFGMDLESTGPAGSEATPIGVGARLRKKLWLPQITGGGLGDHEINGFIAPRGIPRILIVSWVFSLVLMIYPFFKDAAAVIGR